MSIGTWEVILVTIVAGPPLLAVCVIGYLLARRAGNAEVSRRAEEKP